MVVTAFSEKTMMHNTMDIQLIKERIAILRIVR